MTRRPVFWIGITALLFIIAIAAIAARSLNLDAAWYLYVAGALRDGARLYQDVSDTNPPLIVGLSWPALWIAALLRVPETTAFNIYVTLIAAGSWIACARLAARVWRTAAPEMRGLLLAAVAFCVMPFVKADFGEREHVMLLLALPYVLLAAADASARPSMRSAVAIGIAGGLGFAIKPHFVVGWAVIELAVFFRSRFSLRTLLRPELVAAAAVVLMYVAGVVVFFPEYFSVLADVRQMYGGLDSPVSSLVRLPDIAMWLAAATLMISFRLDPDAARPVSTLFAATSGFLLTGLLQFKWWGYHMYPARALMILFFMAFAAGLLHSAPSLTTLLRGGLRTVSLVLAAALVASGVRYLQEARHPPAPDLVPPLVEVIRQQQPRGPVAMLSMRTHMYPAFPAVNEAGTGWSLRFASLWYLPGLYEREMQFPDAERGFRAPSAMSEVERRYFDGVVSDLCAAPPAVFIVEPPIPRAPAGRRSLDLVAYYGQDARFARLFAGYAPVSWLGSFTIYTRKSPEAGVTTCQ